MIIQTPSFAALNSIAGNFFIHHALLSLVGAYVVCLVIVNLVPSLRVRSFGWMSLSRVAITLPGVTVKIDKISLKLDLFWRSSSPFRLATIRMSGVDIVKHDNQRRKKTDRKTNTECSNFTSEDISFTIPKLLHNILIQRNWLNKLSLQLYHVSFHHHAIHEDLSLHLDYIKIDSTIDAKNAAGKVTISVLDGYVDDSNGESDLDGLHVFHNLELTVKSAIVFSCSTKNSKAYKTSLSNIDLLMILGYLRVRQLSQLLTQKQQSGLSNEHRYEIPSLRSVLAGLNMIASIQIKLEQSEVQFKELKLVSSSYSFSYFRDTSYKQQTTAKLSSYITAASLYHLDSKCIDLPSLTYILNIDLTDFYRAAKTQKKEDFTIDLFTTLSMTNPSFYVFFDQLDFLLDLFPDKKNSKVRKRNAAQTDISTYLTHVQKSSVKLVVVDLRGQLHMPKGEQKSFSRQSVDNVVSDAGAQAFAFKFSSKNLRKLISEECMSSKGAALKSFVKLRNLYVEVEENKILLSGLSALVGYCLNTQKVGLRISTKRIQLKSVNSMIFHVIRKIREARISSANRACAKLSERRELSQCDTNSIADDLKKELLDLFEVLPPIIHAIKFRSSVFSSYIICNDWLPSHVIHDEVLNDDVDLADFKRGVSLWAGALEIDYKRQEEVLEVRLKQVQVNTLSDYSSEYVEDFDKRNTGSLGDADVSDNSSLESGFSGFSSIEAKESVQTVKNVLKIDGISLRNPPGNRNKLILSVPEIEGRADMYLVWCVLYAHTLIEMIAPKIEATYTKEEARELHNVSKIIDFDVEIVSMSAVVRLPHDVDILVELDNLTLKDAFVAPHCRITYMRLYVTHPTTRLWSRLISVTDADINLDLVSRNSILLKTKALRFNIPFQFLVYTVIDNVITFFKAARQIWANFKSLSSNIHDYSRIEPEAREAISVPHVQLKSDIMGITLENDEFETQLSLIYQFGAIENVERRRKLAAFEQKAATLRAQVKERLSDSHVENERFSRTTYTKKKPNVLTKALFNTTGNSHREGTTNKAKKQSLEEDIREGADPSETSSKAQKLSLFKDVFCGNANSERGQKNSKEGDVKHDDDESNENMSSSDFPMSEDEVEAYISEAYNELLRDFSSSWVNKFEKYKSTYHDSWKRRMESIWGMDKINKLMRSKFDIQEYSRGPPQFQGAFKDLDFIIDDPQLDNVHDFLNEYGKGQPHLDYSILIPAQVHLRSSSVYMSLRDYALPFISFPSSGDPDQPVMDLKGTVVINERLIQISEELRQIFVPFSPATAASHIVDNFYSVSVIRTLTPVKMMFNLESSVNTDRACVVSWCKAYQPALSSAMMAFENFTKPEIDDSPLGWWDKLALIAHGKIKFDIKHELCLHMKSSNSPYALIGNSSGLVFCWKDNVSLRINDTGKQSELVILESDDFILGIPNYSATEGQAWSLLNSNSEGDQTDSDAETGKFQKRVVKLTSDEKVKWSLGFLFERNKDQKASELSADMERTDRFKPHYDVIVTGPQYDYHPDSFEDFRSDYTHLSINVNSSSKKGNSHNYAYLTPLTLEYIKVWWKTLNDEVSLPIREGKLFEKSAFKESSVKFGPHLFTLKYQIVLEPLTISDIYLSSGGKDTNHNVVAYGAKGKASKCSIDLHQRREIARYVNEKLGIDKKIRKLKMNLGEVEVCEADIRLIFAQFNDISMTGKLLSYYSGETDQPMNLESYEREVKDHNERARQFGCGMVGEEEDFPWIDFDDFIEMEEHDILSPDTTVKIVPFFKTPRFTYFREFTLEHPEGLHPFGHESSHDCLIGMNSPDEVQAQLVELRSTEIELKLNEYIKKSEKLAEDTGVDDEKKRMQLARDISHWKRKLNHLHKLREKFSNCSHTPSIDDITKLNTRLSSESGAEKDLKPRISRTLSIYSAISSLNQAREVINANSLLSDYHNRFLIHNLKLMWNNQVRDIFTSFLSIIGHRKTESLSMTRKAIDLMDKLLKSSEEKSRQSDSEPSFVSQKEFACGSDVIEAFDEYLTKLECETEEIESKYLVKLIKPQIHLQSKSNPKACVLMTSKDIELRVFCVNHEGTDDIVTDSDDNTSLLETRYGVLCRDTRVFSFEEDDFRFKSKRPYGVDNTRETWPPWINLEDNDDLEHFLKNLVIEKTTMAFSLRKPNMLAIDTCKGHSRKSEVVVHMAKLVINATSKQYCAFYFILTDLLIHGNEKNYFLQRIEQISSVSEASDFASLADKVKLLQNNIRICKFVILKMNEKSLKLSEQKRKQHAHLKLELCRMKIELCIIIKSLEAKSSNYSGLKAMSRTWAVHVDQLIFHILNDAREPFIDFALATSTFTRLEEADGSNANSVEVSLVQGFNLRKDVVYPELLRPYTSASDRDKSGANFDKEKPMIVMDWKMLNPVGGIRVMNNANLLIQPMQVQLDYDSATDLFDYLFPKTYEESEEKQKSNSGRETKASPEASESETGDESIDSSNAFNSPSKTFKHLWDRSKSSKNESPSIFSRQSPSREAYSGESASYASETSHSGPPRNNKERAHKKSSTRKDKTPDDIAIIMNRSAKYFVVGDFKLDKTNLCISFKAPKHLNIIDVHNLEFSLPQIQYKDKTWDSNDFVLQLKKDVVKVFLSNTGKIISNKFKIKKRKRASTPLRQISDYSHYMSLEDLQEEGRARDSASTFPEHPNDASVNSPDIKASQDMHPAIHQSERTASKDVSETAGED